MKATPITAFITIGSGFRYLIDVPSGARIHGVGTVLDNIDRLFAAFEKYELTVTTRAAHDLREIGTRLRGLPPDATLSGEDAAALRKAMITLRPTFHADAAGKFAYVVSDKRVDVRRLMAEVDSLFGPDVFDRLPGMSRYDLEEAGKCIAFERPTAAAFHVLRGTEGVLRSYYLTVVKRKRIKPPLMWGPVVVALRALRKPPPSELLDNLDNIRKSFRNPTQHPEKSYDIHEAQDLFSLCVDVINRMSVRLPSAVIDEDDDLPF